MRKIVKEVISVLIVAALLVPALIYVAPFLVGGSFSRVIMSGSMEPAILTGSVVIVKSVGAENVEVGDVIVFQRSESEVIHRVVDKVFEDGSFHFRTKGDANDDPDPWIVKPEDVHGTLILTIPGYGYLIRFAGTPLGFTFMLVVPAILLIANEVRKILQLKKGGKVEQENLNASADD